MSDGDDYSDFEVVPQDKDDDVDMWDVEGENEDEIKQAKIQSQHPSPIYILPSLAPTHSRLDLDHWDEFEFRGASGLRFRFLGCVSWSLVLQYGSPSCAHEELWRRKKNEVVVGVEGASGRDATGMQTM